jgi:hypothetical protein
MGIDQKSREVLDEAKESKVAVFFSGDGSDVTFQSSLVRVEEEYLVLENTILPHYIRNVIKSKNFSLMVQMVRFKANKISTDGVNLIFPLESDSVIEETRGSERFLFSAEERVVCEVLNPFDKTTQITKSVMDMSATGISIRTAFASRLFSTGTKFDSMRVLIDGEQYTKTSGTVVYTRKLLDPKGHLKTQVGIKFEGA